MKTLSTLAVICALCLAAPVSLYADDDDLIVLMGSLQTFAHKLQLSLDHGNRELAAFYAHELEEVVEEVEEIEEYNGFAVGQLTAAMLGGPLRELSAALQETEDLDVADGRLDALIGACNACHIATDHRFIAIQRNSNNPFLQSFEVQSR